MSQPATGVVARGLPSFRLGKKKVFLPSYLITLLRRPQHPPNWATFKVPLTFNKFDIRDYLWNLYGVEAVRVRSWVKYSALETLNGRTYRPASQKIMTVEMTKPFTWPAEPEDTEPWNRKLFLAREKQNDADWEALVQQQKGKLPSPAEKGQNTLQRKSLREQAQALLSGQVQWKTDAKLDEDKWAGKTEGR